MLPFMIFFLSALNKRPPQPIVDIFDGHQGILDGLK